jgi:hypothetical protein
MKAAQVSSSRSSFGSNNCGSGRGIAAVAIVVNEVTTQNDDRYGAGDAPVRAAVRSEPFVQPFVRRLLLTPNSRAGAHVHFSFFVVMRENALVCELFRCGRSYRLTSLIPGKFISL